MPRFILALFLAVLASCSNEGRSNAILLDYKDFGPQAMACEIIGMEWWQWQNHGDSRPSRHDVKVVVHQSMPLEYLKKKYPADPLKKQDFRYLECRKALVWLDEKIEENAMEAITDTLKATRKKIAGKCQR